MQGVEAFTYTIKARELVASGSYSRAFDLYIQAFEMCPELKTRVEGEFRNLLNIYNDYLLSLNKVEAIFYNFDRSIECFPGNVFIMNDIGLYLYKFGFLKEACCYFQKALNAETGYVTAEKNLNAVKNFMVERWHYRMLNDKIRNDAYREAIKECITPIKETILDLGTGCGLLTMYAYENDPMTITACDGSDIMIEMSREVFNENKVEDIIMVGKMSTSLNYRDIGGKRTLIITEIFDAGLFGEGILQTVIHAWDNLMAINKPSRIIPFRAEVFAVGVECEFLNSKYRLTDSVLQFLGIPGKNIHLLNSEPYDSEDVVNLKDLKYLTLPEPVIKINFNCIDEMRDKMEKDIAYNTDFTVLENGKINAIVSWFDLYLTDKVMITTNPLAPGRAQAWQQAIFYNFIPATVKENDIYPLKFSCSGGKLRLVDDTVINIDHISVEMLRYLNDPDYMKLILDSVGSVCIYLCQIVDVSCINILDLSPFPVFGFLMLKRGAEHLTCSAKIEEDKNFIIKVLEENDISLSKVTILKDEDLHFDTLKDQKYHVIYGNINDLSGEINGKQRDLLRKIKLTCLSPGALILPNKVILEGKLISSDWLERNNLVDDDNLGYKVAQFMNKYQVSQNFHIDLQHLEYDSISEEATIANCSEVITSEVLNVDIVADGAVNAIICWYKIQLIENGDFISTNRANSFVDGMAFLANPRVSFKAGDVGNILCCVDNDESFKLLVDTEGDLSGN